MIPSQSAYTMQSLSSVVCCISSASPFTHINERHVLPVGLKFYQGYLKSNLSESRRDPQNWNFMIREIFLSQWLLNDYKSKCELFSSAQRWEDKAMNLQNMKPNALRGRVKAEVLDLRLSLALQNNKTQSWHGPACGGAGRRRRPRSRSHEHSRYSILRLFPQTRVNRESTQHEGLTQTQRPVKA